MSIHCYAALVLALTLAELDASSAELDAAGGEPVDYLSAGPVEPTPTKPGRPGTGLGYLRYASERAGSRLTRACAWAAAA